MLTFCKLNMAGLYSILVKFIVYMFFLFPGLLSRYMTGDCKFYVNTCKCLIYKKYLP